MKKWKKPAQQTEDVYRQGSPSGNSVDSQNLMFDLSMIEELDTYNIGYSSHVPSAVIGQNTESAISYIHNPVLEPNTESSHPSTQTVKRKESVITEGVEGETKDNVANKEGAIREPTTLPP